MQVKIASILGIAAALAGAAAGAQPLAPLTQASALSAAFIQHPANCSALMQGRAGIALNAKSKSLAQDPQASADIKEILDAAGNDHIRSNVLRQLLSACAKKS